MSRMFTYHFFVCVVVVVTAFINLFFLCKPYTVFLLFFLFCFFRKKIGTEYNFKISLID